MNREKYTMKHLMRYEGYTSKERVDDILDKISKYGMKSITKLEKDFLDSFVESSNLPPAIKNLSYKSSIWYSKTVTVLPNALAGINSLVKNDFMDGVSRIYSLVAKLFQSKPANFSVSSGFFPGVQMAKLAIGKDRYDAQNFKSSK
jgi:hypothetical protein